MECVDLKKTFRFENVVFGAGDNNIRWRRRG